MAERKRKLSTERWVILGLLVVLASVLAGFGVASGTPSSITTCTKVKTQKTKVISPGSAAKCSAKGKGTVQTWAPAEADAMAYRDLMMSGNDCVPRDFHGMVFPDSVSLPTLCQVDLHGARLVEGRLEADYQDVNFSGANLFGATFERAFVFRVNFTNANLSQAGFHAAFISIVDFTSANLTNANFGGVDSLSALHFANTTCPDGTNSDAHGNTCIGFGM